MNSHLTLFRCCAERTECLSRRWEKGLPYNDLCDYWRRWTQCESLVWCFSPSQSNWKGLSLRRFRLGPRTTSPAGEREEELNERHASHRRRKRAARHRLPLPALRQGQAL